MEDQKIDAAATADGAANAEGTDNGSGGEPQKSAREIELEAENARIRGANATLNRKVTDLENSAADPDDDDGSDTGADEFRAMSPTQLREAAKTNPAAKAWLGLIQEEARSAASDALKPQREAMISKAQAKLVSQFPNYATEAGRGGLNEVLEVAKRNGLDQAADEESALDILIRANAFVNPTAKAAPDPAKQRTQQFATEQAGAADGEKVDDGDYTPEEMAKAQELKCTPEEARRAMKVYG